MLQYQLIWTQGSRKSYPEFQWGLSVVLPTYYSALHESSVERLVVVVAKVDAMIG